MKGERLIAGKGGGSYCILRAPATDKQKVAHRMLCLILLNVTYLFYNVNGFTYTYFRITIQ